MSFVDDEADIVRTDLAGLHMGASKGHVVTCYFELLRKVAALSNHNPRFKLLFRGQGQDYRLNIHGELGLHSCL